MTYENTKSESNHQSRGVLVGLRWRYGEEFHCQNFCKTPKAIRLTPHVWWKILNVFQILFSFIPNFMKYKDCKTDAFRRDIWITAANHYNLDFVKPLEFGWKIGRIWLVWFIGGITNWIYLGLTLTLSPSGLSELLLRTLNFQRFDWNHSTFSQEISFILKQYQIENSIFSPMINQINVFYQPRLWAQTN